MESSKTSSQSSIGKLSDIKGVNKATQTDSGISELRIQDNMMLGVLQAERAKVRGDTTENLKTSLTELNSIKDNLTEQINVLKNIADKL
ncbi:MAG: hypothetical protein C5B43_00395 [Verrucomicrobia bacterium]|nr:MAG: hypothetical protein C5B43_00395 [Verrucomicrobiota bacterium]